MNAIVSWSGGKDSCLACYKAIKAGFEPKYLFNTISSEYNRSMFHGVRSNLLRLQAKSLAIPMIQKPVNERNYEFEFVNAFKKAKKEGIDYGVFGDIFLVNGRKWVEKACKKAGIKPVFPLWEIKSEKIIDEFISAGFKSIVVSANSKFFDKDFIGKDIDEDFIKDLKGIKEVDPCGENGEFHIFVYDGPIFKSKVRFRKGKKILRPSKYWFLDIKKW